MTDVTLSLVNTDGTDAPSWLYLNSPADQGDISVGDTRTIDIAFSPTASLATEGNHTFMLRVTSSNHDTRDIYLAVAVSQSGIGNVLFKISDIYTGTLDVNNDPVHGLEGARITLQNETVTTITASATTDSFGEAVFNDLAAGRYQYRITASNHEQEIGRVWIKPGITVNEDVFLNYNLVTVEWEVNEITIEDTYEITLNTTFETDVPAAVVIAEHVCVPGIVRNCSKLNT